MENIFSNHNNKKYQYPIRMMLLFILIVMLAKGSEGQAYDSLRVEGETVVSDTSLFSAPDHILSVDTGGKIVVPDTILVIQQIPDTPPHTAQAEVETSGDSQGVDRLREELQAPDVRNIISFGKIFWSVVFIVIGYFIIKLLSGILSLIAERNYRYKPAIRRILPIIKIAGWTLIA